MTKLKTCRWCGFHPVVSHVMATIPTCYHIDCANQHCKKKPGTWYYYKLSDAEREWNELNDAAREPGVEVN